MVIYIEVLLIVNVLIHVFTILLIKETTYLKLKKGFYFSIVFDLLYMLLYVYQFDLSCIKYFIPFLLVSMSFKADLITIIKLTLIYYIISYVIFGLAINLKICSSYQYLLIFIIFLIFISIIYVFFKRKQILIKYKIEYTYKNKVYKLDAFFDTGCNLLYKGLPVIIINNKYSFNIHTDDVIYISAANSSSYEKVYIINELKFNNKRIKCYCVFLDIDYEAIVGVNLVSCLHI